MSAATQGFAMTLAEAAQAVAGALAGPAEQLANGVSTDSRKIVAGQLFVALRGPRFDGHQFLAAVRDAGAAGAIVAADHPGAPPSGLSTIAVADTRIALGRLAAAWRARFTMPLVGITGSNGKTTTKEMVAAILAAQAARDGLPGAAVLATRGNLNNEIGVPQMLFELSAATRWAVIEMGMNHPGEIAWLAELARPTVAVVTNAQRAHLEGLGSVAAVAREKGALYPALSAGGVAVINGDDEHAALFRDCASGHRRIVVSLAGKGDVVGRYRPLADGLALDIFGLSGPVSLRLPVFGRHNAANALLAATAAVAAGAALPAVIAGLEGFRNVAGRLTPRAGRAGARLIDDSYNANPDSMRAAIDVLAEIGGRRLLVIGDMGETGAECLALHREIGAYARQRGIDALYALGEAAAEAVAAFGAGARHFATVEALVDALLPELAADACVLVKGSRFMRMERVVAALAADGAPSAVSQPNHGGKERCS